MKWSLFFLFLLVSCGQREKIVQSDKKEIIPEQSINDFTLVQTDRGNEIWSLDARKAEIYGEEKKIKLERIKVRFYENGKVISFLRADGGNINAETKNMFLRGNVKVESPPQKTVIETESLFWDEERRKIYTDDFVKEKREDVIITGYGLEADPSLEKIVIKKDVKAVKKEK